MSQNNNLIPVFTGDIAGTSVQLVDARLLHSFLEVGKVSNWIKARVEQFDFQENEDFITLAKTGELESRGLQGRIDYHLTLDMAKEISMVERNAKGKEARRYFIECEKQLQKPNALRDLPQQDNISALQAILQSTPLNPDSMGLLEMNDYFSLNSLFWITESEWRCGLLVDMKKDGQATQKRAVDVVERSKMERSRQIKNIEAVHYQNLKLIEVNKILEEKAAECDKWRNKYIALLEKVAGV